MGQQTNGNKTNNSPVKKKYVLFLIDPQNHMSNNVPKWCIALTDSIKHVIICKYSLFQFTLLPIAVFRHVNCYWNLNIQEDKQLEANHSFGENKMIIK